MIAGPASGEQILIAQGSMEAVFAAKAGCDVTGHYSRPDIFQLLVNGQAVVPGAELNFRQVNTRTAPSSIADPFVSTASRTIEEEPQAQHPVSGETKH